MRPHIILWKNNWYYCLGLWTKNNIREKFVSFLECSYGFNGQSLYRTIKGFLILVGIYISDCRGQGYDVAGAVAGKNLGLSVHVLRVNPKALYRHCSCHRLNLAVVASCGEQRVQNLMTKTKEISYVIISYLKEISYEISNLICRFHVKTALKTKYCCIAQNPWNMKLKISAELDGLKE